MNCMNGMESSLEDCDLVKVITSREDTCKRDNQARLLCEPGMNFQKWVKNILYIVDCIIGTLRLMGGSTDKEGRVEVCVGGRWGTVQTNQFLEVAESVCRSQSQIVDFYSTSSSYG